MIFPDFSVKSESIEIIINALVSSFCFILNTYVMGLWSLEIFYCFIAGIDYRRHNLTSIDVNRSLR